MNALDKLKGSRPTPDHVWCDECCRWEYSGPGWNEKRRNWIRERGYAKFLSRVGRFFTRIATWFYIRAELAKVRDNKRRGLLIEAKP